MRHLLASLALGVGLALCSPALPVPMGSIATAHAQLVSSSPGAAEVLAAAPAELRLVFSEPLDARSSSLDLLDAGGQPLTRGIGAPDPADPYTMVAAAPRLDHGTYTVTWRTLSAADGHTASGFFTFAVGHGELPHNAHAAAHAEAHSAHVAATMAEVPARLLGYVGLMLAFGLAVVAAAVLRPVTREWPRRVAIAQAIGLATAAAGGILLALVAASGAGLDPLAYLGESRTGQLLSGRVGLAGGGAAVVLALVSRRRTGTAILVAGGVGLTALSLVSLSGHAAAYASPAPAAAIVVHVAAASIWLGGILALADLALVGRHRRTPALGMLVPRFSALALVSVALVALTGLYSAWLQTRDLTSLASPYSGWIALKVALFAAALMLGGLNFLDAGRRAAWLGGFGARVTVEGALGVVVLLATANLATGSPPAQELPISIAPAPSAAVLDRDGAPPLRFAVQPGRPGPNRYRVDLPAQPPPGATVELELQRIDESAGSSRVPLTAGPDATTFVAEGGSLAADSRWDATVVVKRRDGTETARERFTFALDRVGIVEGRSAPPIDPALVVPVLLLALALVGTAYVLAGGTPPRVEARTGRIAVLGGGAASAALGLLLLLGGPRV